MSIAAFYVHTVKPIAEDYAHWLLQNLANDTGKDSHRHHKVVPHISTYMEKIRLARAIYRFQLLCQVAGHVRGTWTRQEEIILAFINAFEPWEIEEMFFFPICTGCIRQKPERD